MIAAVNIPYFAVGILRQGNPLLATLPFIIGEPPQAPERVYAVSPEAVKIGIRPGMPVRQAQVLCPRIHLVPNQPHHYQNGYTELLAALDQFSAVIEPEQIGASARFYLDLGVLPLKKPVELVKALGQAIRGKSGLAPAVGLAKGKFPAHVAASSVKPNRASIVSPGQEAIFLAPRAVTLLPLDQELAYRFHLLGLRTLGQLAALPAGAMLAQFGVQGRWLHQLARGYDDRPVKPQPLPTTEQITRRFDDAIGNRLILNAQCQILAAELAQRLQIQRQAGRELRLTLRLENETTWTRVRLLRQPTGQAGRLSESLTLLLDQARISCGVVGIAISLSELSPMSGEQLELFTLGGEQERRLGEVLPHLAARYGEQRFYQALITSPLASLPEARFQLQPTRKL